ncbi:hypothetical protein CPB86DRAFT_822016 [Serendipita vermifera]|nr:hypothetical protein CPB86DRAFT_822016 [Serendipita vermifera]
MSVFTLGFYSAVPHWAVLEVLQRLSNYCFAFFLGFSLPSSLHAASIAGPIRQRLYLNQVNAKKLLIDSDLGLFIAFLGILNSYWIGIQGVLVGVARIVYEEKDTGKAAASRDDQPPELTVKKYDGHRLVEKRAMVYGI